MLNNTRGLWCWMNICVYIVPIRWYRHFLTSTIQCNFVCNIQRDTENALTVCDFEWTVRVRGKTRARSLPKCMHIRFVCNVHYTPRVYKELHLCAWRWRSSRTPRSSLAWKFQSRDMFLFIALSCLVSISLSNLNACAEVIDCTTQQVFWRSSFIRSCFSALVSFSATLI